MNVMKAIWAVVEWLTRHNIGSLDAYYTHVNWHQEKTYFDRPVVQGTIELLRYWSPVGLYPVMGTQLRLPMAIADVLNGRFFRKHPDSTPMYSVKPVWIVTVVCHILNWLWNKGIGLYQPHAPNQYVTYRAYGFYVWLMALSIRSPLQVIVDDATAMIRAVFRGEYAQWWASVVEHRNAYRQASQADFLWDVKDERTKRRVKTMFAEEKYLNALRMTQMHAYFRCTGASCEREDCECECHDEDGDWYQELNNNYYRDVMPRRR